MVAFGRRRACALLAGVSLSASFFACPDGPASAQTAEKQQPLAPVRVEAPPARKKKTAAKRVPAARTARPRPAPVQPAAAREPTTSVASKSSEAVIDTLAAVSTLSQGQIAQTQPGRLSEAFAGMPSVWFADRGDDPASAINIRGLQDFGRVAVFVDGAAQDFQRSGHFADGQFYLDPELLGGVDVVRGPVANIYGSGAIGGVASFRTKDLDDILLPGETAAIESHGMFGSNGSQWLASTFMGARGALGDIFAGGVYRDSTDYKDGAGQTVQNTDSQVESGLVKFTARPGEGQELKVGFTTYNTDYNFGQTTGEEGVYAVTAKNQTGTAAYSFKSPETTLVDFHTTAYWNQAYVRQTVTEPFVTDGIDFTGPAGTSSSFMVNTFGGEAHNTSRFDTGALRHTVTYGGDFVRDTVDIGDGADPGAPLTPGGRREAYGSFLQWKTNYSSWFEMVNAVRYDGFNLTGNIGSSESGSRLSPKTTVGVTPVPGFTPYFTYAEGYRAPSVTEAFIAGFHPGSLFYFMPNPDLQPEVGKTTEVGLNVKYDSVFVADDKVRAKVNLFRNDISNYIDLTQSFVDFTGMVPPPPQCLSTPFFYTDCFQYTNVGSARIEGIEFEGNYDAGRWFAGMSGQPLRGENRTLGTPLATIPPDQVSFIVGARAFDNKLTVAVRWTAVAAKTLSQIPLEQGDSGPVPIFDPTPSYNLVNLYIGYKPTPNVLAAFSVENLLNVDYTKYMCCSTAAGYVVPSPGVTFKGSLTLRYGVKEGT